MTNKVTIDITATDKTSLSQLVAAQRAHGKAMGQALAEGLDSAQRATTQQAERTTRESGNKMTSAMRGAVRQMTGELDKLERAAALSGDGMSAEYAAALADVRGNLNRVAEAGSRMGGSLEGDLGDALRSVGRDIDALKPKTDRLGKAMAEPAAEVDKAFSEMARNTARLLDRIELEAHEMGDGMGDAMSAATRSMRADLERVQAEARQTGGRLDTEIGTALKNIQRDARRTRQELEEALNPKNMGDTGGGLGEALSDSMAGGFDPGSLFDGLLGKAGMGAGVAAAGAAIGTVLWDQAYKALQQGFAEKSIGSLISVQSGGTVREGWRLGKIVGDNFSEGFGTSIEDVGAAANAALSKGLVSMDAPQAVLDEITEMSSAAAEITGHTADEVAGAIRVMLQTGLASNTREAFDLIVTGFQRGANAGDDLLEVLTRSSTNLKQFGFTGETAVGAFKQALDAGAPSADAFTGALEELIGNATDGIPIFQRLGLGGQEFAAALVGGGPKAAQALDQLLDRIRAIEDPAERSATIVSLFGEEATAMQDAILAVDLSSAENEMKGFEGQARRTADQLIATRDPIDKMQRGITDFLKGPLDNLDSMVMETGNSFGKTTDKTIEWTDATDEASNAGQIYASTLEEIISQQSAMVGGVVSFNEAQINAIDAINEANEAAKEYAGQGLNESKTGFDLTTEAGQELSAKLLDVADSTWKTVDAMREQNMTNQEVQTYVEGSKQKFIELATQMGIGSDAAAALAERLFEIPLTRQTTLSVQDARARAQLAAYQVAATVATRNRRSQVDALTSGALAKIRLFEIAANIATRNRVMDIIVRQSTGGLLGWGPPRRESGGITSGIWGAQSGGQRHGSTMINEAGPEIVELPDGSKVMTAGASRAAMEAGLLGGGGSGPIAITLGLENADSVARALLGSLRVIVSSEYGGSVQRALGRGAA